MLSLRLSVRARLLAAPRAVLALRHASAASNPPLENHAKAAEAASMNDAGPRFRRFWSQVNLDESPGRCKCCGCGRPLTRNAEGYAVLLDARTLKTPDGNVLRLPRSKERLAMMLAAEWNSLHTATIRHYSLPLTSLCSRALDFWAVRAGDSAAKAAERDATRCKFLRYLDTDATLIYSPAHEYNGRLLEAQKREWGALRTWAQDLLGTPVSAQEDSEFFTRHEQSAECRAAALHWLEQLNPWEMTAFERILMTTKSFLLAARMVAEANEPDGIQVEEAARLADLETRFQTERWGEVEDTHDVNHADMRRQLASSKLVLIDQRAD